jgi:hypothetical protein
MFARRFSFVMAFLLAFLVLGVVPAKAEKRTAFEGTIVWNTWVPISDRYVGTNDHFEFIWIGELQTNAPEINGIGTFYFKCNARMTTPMPWWGPCVGTWSVNVDVDADPEWSGNFTVLPQVNGPYNVAKIDGHGDGEYVGKQVQMTMLGTDPMQISGEILDPKGN